MAPAKKQSGLVHGKPIEKKIVQWFQESGMFTNSERQPNLKFIVQGRYPAQLPPPNQPMNIAVLQPISDPSVVMLVGNVVFNSDHRTAINEMDEAAKHKFLRELQSELLFRCNFLFQQDPTTKELLGIQLSDELYADAPITKETLIKHIQNLFRCYLFISWRLQGLVPRIEPCL